MQDVEKILDRMRQMAKVKTNEELMVFLGYAIEKIEDWKYFKEIPYPILRRFSDKLKRPVSHITGKEIFTDNNNSVIINGKNTGKIINTQNEEYIPNYSNPICIREIKIYELIGDDVEDRQGMKATEAAEELLDKHGIEYEKILHARFKAIIEDGLCYPLVLRIKVSKIKKEAEQINYED